MSDHVSFLVLKSLVLVLVLVLRCLVLTTLLFCQLPWVPCILLVFAPPVYGCCSSLGVRLYLILYSTQRPNTAAMHALLASGSTIFKTWSRCTPSWRLMTSDRWIVSSGRRTDNLWPCPVLADLCTSISPSCLSLVKLYDTMWNDDA